MKKLGNARFGVRRHLRNEDSEINDGEYYISKQEGKYLHVGKSIDEQHLSPASVRLRKFSSQLKFNLKKKKSQPLLLIAPFKYFILFYG